MKSLSILLSFLITGGIINAQTENDTVIFSYGIYKEYSITPDEKNMYLLSSHRDLGDFRIVIDKHKDEYNRDIHATIDIISHTYEDTLHYDMYSMEVLGEGSEENQVVFFTLELKTKIVIDEKLNRILLCYDLNEQTLNYHKVRKYILRK